MEFSDAPIFVLSAIAVISLTSVAVPMRPKCLIRWPKAIRSITGTMAIQIPKKARNDKPCEMAENEDQIRELMGQ